MLIFAKNYSKMRLSIIKIMGIFMLSSFIMLFYASPDSYTHDLFQRTDFANFYTSGKRSLVMAADSFCLCLL